MFNERDNVASILLSMFLGLLVVLLVGGLALNLIGNRRNARNARTGTISKVGLFDQMKQKFNSMQEKTALNKENKAQPEQKNIIKPSSKTNPQNQTSTFLNVVKMSGVTGLDMQLEKGEVFTVFMPHNQAFAESQEPLDHLMTSKDKNAVQNLVKRHMVRGKVSTGVIQTLSGDNINVDFTQNTVTFNGNVAHIVETRGDTIIIDRVLY